MESSHRNRPPSPNPFLDTVRVADQVNVPQDRLRRLREPKQAPNNNLPPTAPSTRSAPKDTNDNPRLSDYFSETLATMQRERIAREKEHEERIARLQRELEALESENKQKAEGGMAEMRRNRAVFEKKSQERHEKFMRDMMERFPRAFAGNFPSGDVGRRPGRDASSTTKAPKSSTRITVDEGEEYHQRHNKQGRRLTKAERLSIIKKQSQTLNDRDSADYHLDFSDFDEKAIRARYSPRQLRTPSPPRRAPLQREGYTRDRSLAQTGVGHGVDFRDREEQEQEEEFEGLIHGLMEKHPDTSMWDPRKDSLSIDFVNFSRPPLQERPRVAVKRGKQDWGTKFAEEDILPVHRTMTQKGKENIQPSSSATSRQLFSHEEQDHNLNWEKSRRHFNNIRTGSRSQDWTSRQRDGLVEIHDKLNIETDSSSFGKITPGKRKSDRGLAAGSGSNSGFDSKRRKTGLLEYYEDFIAKSPPPTYQLQQNMPSPPTRVVDDVEWEFYDSDTSLESESVISLKSEDEMDYEYGTTQAPDPSPAVSPVPIPQPPPLPVTPRTAQARRTPDFRGIQYHATWTSLFGRMIASERRRENLNSLSNASPTRRNRQRHFDTPATAVNDTEAYLENLETVQQVSPTLVTPQRRRSSRTLPNSPRTPLPRTPRLRRISEVTRARQPPPKLLRTPLRPAQQPLLLDCHICMDSHSPTVLTTTACSHRICNGCLESMVRVATTDASSFPLRCCVPIPINTLYHSRSIPARVLDAYRRKVEERQDTSPIYCSNVACGKHIPKRYQEDGTAQCPSCRQATCMLCQRKSHGGLCEVDAVADENARMVILMARQDGWKRCPRCKVFVEKREGCNHISCICGAHFCYCCGTIRCRRTGIDYSIVQNFGIGRILGVQIGRGGF